MSVVEQLSPSQRARAIHARLMRPANAVRDEPKIARIPLAAFGPSTDSADPLAEYGPRNNPVEPVGIPIPIIQQIVCDIYGLSLMDLISARRERRISLPRQIALYLCRRMTLQSLPTIGRLFKKDHTTVMYAAQRVEKMMQESPLFATDINDLAKAIEVRHG
jgi:hypothetical protein